jgi:hypothetical protein
VRFARLPYLFERKHSTNPIWRLAPVFGQLGSCDLKTNLVIIDDGAVGIRAKEGQKRDRSNLEGSSSRISI